MRSQFITHTASYAAFGMLAFTCIAALAALTYANVRHHVGAPKPTSQPGPVARTTFRATLILLAPVLLLWTVVPPVASAAWFELRMFCRDWWNGLRDGWLP